MTRATGSVSPSAGAIGSARVQADRMPGALVPQKRRRHARAPREIGLTVERQDRRKLFARKRMVVADPVSSTIRKRARSSAHA
jgi:hypothetical protein